MPDSPALAFVTQALELLSRMNHDEVRGTIRIALHEAGFCASTVGVRELRVVLEQVLPRQLALRISDGAESCQKIAAALEGMRDDAADGREGAFATIQRNPAPGPRPWDRSREGAL